MKVQYILFPLSAVYVFVSSSSEQALSFVTDTGKESKSGLHRENEKTVQVVYYLKQVIEDNETRNPCEVVIDHTTERNNESNGHPAPEMQFPSYNIKSEDANSSYSSSSGIDNLIHDGVDNIALEQSIFLSLMKVKRKTASFS